MQDLDITLVHAIMGLWVQHVTIEIIVALTHVVETECVQTLKMVFTIFANVIMAIKDPNARQLIVVLLTLAMGKARARTRPRRLTINVHVTMDIKDPLVKLKPDVMDQQLAQGMDIAKTTESIHSNVLATIRG